MNGTRDTHARSAGSRDRSGLAKLALATLLAAAATIVAAAVAVGTGLMLRPGSAGPSPAVAGLLIVVFSVVFGGAWIQLARTATRTSRARPRRLLRVEADAPVEAVHAALLRLAHDGRYRLEEDALDAGVVTLSSSPSAFSSGFFFPVFLTRIPGGTSVEVGITSRLIQLGPVVGHHHRAFVAALRETSGLSLTDREQGRAAPRP